MSSRRRRYYRMAAAVAVATALFLVWGIAALGIIGEGGKPDRMFAGVLAVLVLGVLVARLRPAGMSVALFATAGAQMLVAGVALVAGLQDTPGASAAEIVGLNAMYASLFAWSAWLFRRAAEEQPSTVPVGRG